MVLYYSVVVDYTDMVGADGSAPVVSGVCYFKESAAYGTGAPKV